jgi:ABC-type uncharacterized transport system involved in gliding motility auxiliary subunit
LDLTRDRLFTLAPGSRQILGNLDDLVQVKLFVSKELPPEIQLQLRDVQDLLSDLRRASNGNIRLQEVDPGEDDDAANEAQSLGIYPVEFNVLRDDEFQLKRGYYGMAILYAGEHEVIPVIQRTDDLEFRLVSAIHSMTTTQRPGVAFLQGFGARGESQLPDLRQGLAKRYDLHTIRMAPDSTPVLSPDSNRVVILAGPTQALDSTAVARLSTFVNSGGAALLLLEPMELNPQSPQPIPVYSGLDGFLKDHGLRFTPSLVADLRSSEQVSLGQRGLFNVIAPYPLWPIVSPAGDHITTRGLSNLTLTWAGALEVLDSTRVTPLWQTTEAGTLRGLNLPILPDQDWDTPRDQLSVLTVAAAVDPGAASDGEEAAPSPAGRMVVVGDESFLEPQAAQANAQNVLFGINAVDWLAQDESLIRIRSKNRTPPALAFTNDWSQGFLKWGNLFGVPLLFVLFGALRITGRRRRAEARWKEVLS